MPRTTPLRTIAALSICLAAIGSAHATTNLVTNGSMTGPAMIGSPPPAWASLSTDGDTIPVGGLSGWAPGIGASPDGDTFLALLNNGGGGSYDAVSQSISGFSAGQTYTLEFYYTNAGLSPSLASNYANPGDIRASIGGNTFDSPTLANDGFGNQQWFDYKTTFVATAGTLTLTLAAVREGDAIGGYAGGIDGVSISATTVPEPSGVALMLAGIGALGWRVRRTARQA